MPKFILLYGSYLHLQPINSIALHFVWLSGDGAGDLQSGPHEVLYPLVPRWHKMRSLQLHWFNMIQQYCLNFAKILTWMVPWYCTHCYNIVATWLEIQSNFHEHLDKNYTCTVPVFISKWYCFVLNHKMHMIQTHTCSILKIYKV